MTPASPPESYPHQVFVHTDPPAPEHVDPVALTDHGIGTKPAGGMWTSSLHNGSSAWVEWMHRERFFPHPDASAWELTPADGLELFVIDDLAALRALTARYPLARDRVLPGVVPVDFEAAAADLDGIWLTEGGLTATRFEWPGLYAWDCESTLHFDWNFSAVAPLDVDVDIDDRSTSSHG